MLDNKVTGPVPTLAAPPPASDAEPSVTDLSASLSVVLDQLQTALAKLGGADAPSQQYGDPAAGRALALIAAGIDAPDEVHMETRALHEHLQRLFGLFSAAGKTDSMGLGVVSGARMTALGFRKLVRAAQLTCERCTDVDVDLIFQQVVRTRGARMSMGDMMVGLSMVAKRLYPEERTQSSAFHRLLSEQMLPWMLQYAPARPLRPPASARCCAHPNEESSYGYTDLSVSRFDEQPCDCIRWRWPLRQHTGSPSSPRRPVPSPALAPARPFSPSPCTGYSTHWLLERFSA